VTKGVGRLLILAQPAGGVEEFFHEFALLGPEQMQDFPLLKGMFAKYGMQICGPPFEDAVQ
jgi:hypothetical protein